MSNETLTLQYVNCSFCKRGFVIAVGAALPRHYYNTTRFHTGGKHLCDGKAVPIQR